MSRRRYLITRTADGARKWAMHLQAAGAEAICLPCLSCQSIATTDQGRAVAKELNTALDEATWLALTSARGVQATADLLRLVDATVPPKLEICAVGPATARACEQAFGRLDVLAPIATGRALAEHLLTMVNGLPGTPRLVVAAADRGRRDFETVLGPNGVEIRRFAVYRTVPAPPEEPKRDLRELELDAILLASPSALEGLLNVAHLPPTVPLVTIGATTSEAVRQRGLRVATEAATPSIQGMLEAIRDRFEP